MSAELSSELEEYALQHGLKVEVCNASKPIFSQGDVAKGLYYILDNHVKILKEDRKGNSIFLWFAKSKELIGLTSYFQGDGNYTCSAITGERPCKYIFFPNADIDKLLKQSPTFKHILLKILCERISFMEMRTNNMLYQNIDARIIETLLFLAAKENGEKTSGKNKSSRIYYTKKELAEMVGASLEYFRRRIKELKSKQLIDYGKNWLLINDIDELRLLI